MIADIVWLGIPEFAGALEAKVMQARAAARAAVAELAGELEKTAKENASGRPGPNVITGTLRRSIRHEPIRAIAAGGWETRVGVGVIYGRRIELGFHGTDSIGRYYNQPGYPYFRPAFRKLLPRAESIYAKHWTAALTS